jgi:drug/metabolite transporter (DMT)-like permease
MHQSKLSGPGVIAALCSAATWGMVGIFVRWLPGWSVFAVLSGRFFSAAVAMLIILFLVSALRTDRRALRSPLLWWLCMPAIASAILGTTAFQMAPVGEVTLLITTAPLFIIAYKYAARLPVKPGESAGMLLTMVGVILVILPQLSAAEALAEKLSGQTMTGYFLSLGSAGFLAIYTAWLNRLTQQRRAPKSFYIVFATCLLGGVVSFLCARFAQPLTNVVIDRQAIAILSALGVFSTAAPFLCYTFAAQRLPVLLATAILLLEPVFAVLYASVAFQEIPSSLFAFGSFIIFGGLLLIAKEDNVN